MRKASELVTCQLEPLHRASAATCSESFLPLSGPMRPARRCPHLQRRQHRAGCQKAVRPSVRPGRQRGRKWWCVTVIEVHSFRTGVPASSALRLWTLLSKHSRCCRSQAPCNWAHECIAQFRAPGFERGTLPFWGSQRGELLWGGQLWQPCS